jgi:hypothetical protein
MHYKLIKLIRDKYNDEPDNPMKMDILDLDDRQLFKFVFLNFRYHSGEPAGKRLTNLGLMQLKSMFKNWTIEVIEKPITSKMRLFMDRNFIMPYHVDHSTITIFEKQMAMKLILVGNSFVRLMELHNGQ